MDNSELNTFYTMLNSPIFLSSLFGWFMAQFLKSIIAFFRNIKHSQESDSILTFLWRTGGMPSSHSAAATALTTSIGFTMGIHTPLFISMLLYNLLVIRDALGVRKSAGIQAKALNALGLELKERFGIEFSKVKEINGHNGSEVSVGILLGFFIAVAFCNL